MMRKTFEFALLFIKMLFNYKVAYVWTLIIPIIFMVWNNRIWFSQSPSELTFLSVIILWWAYIIVISASNGIGLALLSLRENGFLKMFKFITGSKYPIIYGQVISQFLFILLNISIFTLTVGLLFNYNNIFNLLLISVLLVTISILPIASLFLWVPTLPFKMESIAPIFNISIFPLLLIASSRPSFDSFWINFVFMLNPIEYSKHISYSLYKFLILDQEVVLSQSILIITLLYLVIGIYFIKKIRITSSVRRD